MATKPILLLGNPALYRICEPVDERDRADLIPVIRDLHDTMMAFRAQHGCGRAIAAPQIGVPKRLVYMHIDCPVAFINPVFESKSDATIELWDDCMSFPDLLVKVGRHKTCRIAFRDENWAQCHMDLEDDLSELLQHEIDHLDGILAVQRAVDGRSFALKGQRQFLEGGR